MSDPLIAQKQRTLASMALLDPEYRFERLYDLLHWDVWIDEAAQAVLSRKGSRTDGVDGKTRDYFKKTYEGQLFIPRGRIEVRCLPAASR